ncbi:FbpA domain protein [Plasmodium gonderi]|uniref:FbpA domain protein n=1 Tax=Plasmodium gonderi TaxID=77519 RepID=A0A1Y1JUK5_PLAGO|nr:FbpA domain protein [Plasmodium gonderi]GAW83594.1 FbpA domain protein [Plasmodium gonderi]
MILPRILKLFIWSTILVSRVMNERIAVLSRCVLEQSRPNFHFIKDNNKAKYIIKKRVFFFNKKRVMRSELKNNEQGINYKKNNMIFKYTKYDEADEVYVKLLEKKANEIKTSKNCFNNKIKNMRNEDEGLCQQRMDYTTLHLLSIELNALLQDCVVEHITETDNKTIVLHLNKRGEKEYYLYICYDNDNPVISLGLKIKKLFNRFIDDNYAQKLNPVLKYSLISDIYVKKKFVKILCIDFILKRKMDEDIDIEDILGHRGDSSQTNSSRKVTLLFDLHNNSCISFVINKENNEILISPHNYITEKVIDNSYKEGHIYNFPANHECKIIPNEYEFFSSFVNLFKARKEQNFISSLLDIYEGLSYNVLLKILNHLNISSNAKFAEIDSGLLLDFFNKTYIKWVRFLNLKEKDETISFYPHFDYKLNIYSVLKFFKKNNRDKNNFLSHLSIQKLTDNDKMGMNTPVDPVAIGSFAQNDREHVSDKTNHDEKEIISVEDVPTKETDSLGKNPIDSRNDYKREKGGNNKLGYNYSENANKIDREKETHFETTIELVYYYYGRNLSVNKFYTILKYCKEFIKKKMLQYEEMIKQYKNDLEVCEKAYLLHDNINKLSVFNHTISKMNDWVDKKTFEALKLIEKELKYNSLEDNRKKYVKKMEEKKEKEEIFRKQILNVKPNTIKSSQNIYKGSLLIKVNETDLSSPFLIIGRNSKQNEKISTQILKFNDLWFHVHEHPGGHVILRNKKINGKIITPDLNLEDIKIDDDIKYAANMAAYFSKARKIEKTIVCFTFGKYVLKDNTLNEGAVELLKYRLVYGRFVSAIAVSSAHLCGHVCL